MNTAGATIRQLVSLVFERLATEIDANKKDATDLSVDVDINSLRQIRNLPPKGLTPTAADAFLMFQVISL